MTSHGSRNITELLINASALDLSGSGLEVTDAGPPPSPLFLFFWLCASVLGYLIFVVARPLARESHEREVSGKVWTTARRKWLARQLYAVPWAWALTDGLHRLFCYLLLRPTTLWRRQLLPLPTWMDPWLSQLRLHVFCGSLLEGFNPRLRTFYAATMELLEHRPSSQYTTFNASHECGLDWLLPVADSLLAPAPHLLEKVSAFPSAAARVAALQEYRMVALYAVLASLFVCFYVFLNLLSCIHGRSRRKAAEEDLPADRQGEKNAKEDEEKDTANAGQAALVVPDDTAAQKPRRRRGEADDSWVNSPEAAEEEARWAKREVARARKAAAAAQRATSRGVTAAVQECWPALAACVYGGMYAAVGDAVTHDLVFPAL
ncbi:hypothetical protein STCU_07751 [Strigomonas culicis]|uniref:Transmembrane protein n=1 Tax=Strigomonas culicis TaxID=28005 RepID=S9U3G9_9TRYP|nr:hypothetical protein STCU_07751 [Strigomonas culicis]|eukprot:EPY23354.1 hypothetical protein STCU_07751 [Strigomonas culicis]